MVALVQVYEKALNKQTREGQRRTLYSCGCITRIWGHLLDNVEVPLGYPMETFVRERMAQKFDRLIASCTRTLIS